MPPLNEQESSVATVCIDKFVTQCAVILIVEAAARALSGQRKSAGLSQQALSKKSKIRLSRLQSIERAEVAATPKEMTAITQALNMNEKDLSDGFLTHLRTLSNDPSALTQ